MPDRNTIPSVEPSMSVVIARYSAQERYFQPTSQYSVVPGRVPVDLWSGMGNFDSSVNDAEYKLDESFAGLSIGRGSIRASTDLQLEPRSSNFARAQPVSVQQIPGTVNTTTDTPVDSQADQPADKISASLDHKSLQRCPVEPSNTRRPGKRSRQSQQ